MLKTHNFVPSLRQHLPKSSPELGCVVEVASAPVPTQPLLQARHQCTGGAASYHPTAATAIKKEVNPQTRVGSKIALEPGDQLNLLGPNSKVERRENNSLLCCCAPAEKLLIKVGRFMYYLHLAAREAEPWKVFGQKGKPLSSWYPQHSQVQLAHLLL